MATDDALAQFLSRVDPDPALPRNWAPGDLGRLSVESFLASRLDTARDIRSSGSLRLHGPGVDEHSADLSDVGKIATTWQRLVSAIGASLENIKSFRGQLPSDIAHRTRLSLTASPEMGSVVLRVSPKADPLAEVAPEGTVPMMAVPRPLADRASTQLVALLGSAAKANLSSVDELSETMLSLGPRVGGSLLSLVSVLHRSSIALDAAWREPEQPTVKAEVTPEQADWIRTFIAGRDLAASEEQYVGVLRTISDADRWLIDIEGGKPLRMDATDLEPATFAAVHVSQRVRVKARTSLREQPDGRVRASHRILDVEPAPDQPDQT